MKPLAAALGTALCLTACARGSNTATTVVTRATTLPSAAPARTAAPRPAAPHTSPSLQPQVVSGPAGSAHAQRPAPPHASASPAAPEILSASVSPTLVGSGSVVSATVRTTPGVVSVTAYAGGASMPVPRAGPGIFSGRTTLPPMPFVHGSYAVTFVARDARGSTTQSAVGVTVR